MKSLLESQTIDKWIYSSEKNDGIVISRIRIYEEIKKDDFDFLLELHSDMLFPKNWSAQLFEIFDNAGKRYENRETRKPIPAKDASNYVKSFEKKIWV
jgi:hypothetical protein